MKNEKESIFELVNIAYYKQKAFLENIFGYNSFQFEETKQYFSNWKDNTYKFKTLEEDIKNFKYVFIYLQKQGLNNKEYFSVGFPTLIGLKTWLSCLENHEPVCLIINGKLSNTKFTTRQLIKIREEDFSSDT